jgi:hypothetical protein
MDHQLEAHEALKVVEEVFVRSRRGDEASERIVCVLERVGGEWCCRLAEMKDIRHSNGSHPRGYFVDEVDAVALSELHRPARTDRQRLVVVVHAVLRRGILLEVPPAVPLEDATLLRAHLCPPDMHVVEPRLGRLGPLGVATAPDQHAAIADEDGRVSLPVNRCKVRL